MTPPRNDLPIRIIDDVQDTDALLEVASKVGNPIFLSDGNLVKELHVTDSVSAKPNTLSSRFGMGIFPFHTDTAFWNLPARWILLRAVSGDLDRPTYLQSFQDLFQGLAPSLIRRSAWICDTGSSKKYSTISFTPFGEEGFRYDPSCMQPANNAARQVDGVIRHRCLHLAGEEIKWIPNRVAIIDNWAWLHARGESSAQEREQTRILQRVYVK